MEALRPGQLVATVQDEGDDQVLVFEAKIRGQLAESLILQEAEASEAEAPDGHLGAYKPPRIAQAMCFSLRGFFPRISRLIFGSLPKCFCVQVEYTGDHISMQASMPKSLYFYVLFVSVFAG